MKPVTETLKSLIASHGEEILQQPQRIKAMLADLLPHEKRMRYLLEVSLRAEIPKKLTDIQQDEKEVRETKTNSIKHYFKEEYFLEDNAVKSVFDCWMEVIKNTLTNPVIYSEPVTDIDGNVYKTVQIGNQIWMAENLRVSRYRNGDIIPNITDDEKWSNMDKGAWCNYLNDPAYDSEFGKLYNWYTIDDERELAPEGWHVSTNEDWTILEGYLGGYEIAGGKLKETGTINWEKTNEGTTNESGFCALPGGGRINGKGKFYLSRFNGYWWCSKSHWYWCLNYGSNQTGRGQEHELFGCSVRCVKNIEQEPITDII